MKWLIKYQAHYFLKRVKHGTDMGEIRKFMHKIKNINLALYLTIIDMNIKVPKCIIYAFKPLSNNINGADKILIRKHQPHT